MRQADRHTTFIGAAFKKAGGVLCLLGCLLILMVPAQTARAESAIDDPAHREGLEFALRENWIAAWMMMTEQFVTVMMQQMLILGTFLDAEQQLEVQRLFQQLKAEAHKDYHPSFQMCQFGTTVKSLAASDVLSDENTRMLDYMMEKRERLSANLAAAPGIVGDMTHRIDRFKDIFCDLDENNQHVIWLCEESQGPQAQVTRDMDYARFVDHPYTLNINYADDDLTTEEQDILSLGQNLYAHKVIDFMPEQLLNELGGQSMFMETRSVHAIRSVARRSFSHMVGMRAEGPQELGWQVTPFLNGIVHELGVPEEEIVDFIGENPSYFAQMEVLTRKIYQSPEFFTNLYDKPANVRRIGVALQALELMQDRDRFESALRREMLISLIVELKLREFQEDMNTRIFSASHRKNRESEF